jgi:four helix bundle protein
MGHSCVLDIYKVTRRFPQDELFGLTSQMRRAVVSVTSNIAEGFGRRGLREKARFYSISQGSLTELQNLLLVTRDVSLMTSGEFDDVFSKTVETHKMLTGLIKSVRSCA